MRWSFVGTETQSSLAVHRVVADWLVTSGIPSDCVNRRDCQMTSLFGLWGVTPMTGVFLFDFSDYLGTGTVNQKLFISGLEVPSAHVHKVCMGLFGCRFVVDVAEWKTEPVFRSEMYIQCVVNAMFIQGGP